MNEIEQTTKELERLVKLGLLNKVKDKYIYPKWLLPYCKNKRLMKGIMKVSKLGEELAKKEFLEIIKSLENEEGCPYCAIPMRQLHFCKRCNDRVITGSSYYGLIEYIKQKLGDKTE